MAYAIAQHTSGSGTGTGLTVAKTLSGTPSVGNLLLAFIFTGNSTTPATLTFNTTSWTIFERAIDTSNNNQVVTGLYRYVQAGDTSTMPAFCTAGSTFFAYTVQEVSGVLGSWSLDYLSSSNNQFKGTGAGAITSYAQTTFAANSFAIIGFSKYNESAAGSVSAGWTADENTFNSGNYGAYGCAHQSFSTAGSSVQATFTPAGTANNTEGIIQVILTPSRPNIPTIVRCRYFSSTPGSPPGSVLFPGTPTPGNLLVTMLSWSDGSQVAPTVNTSNWTQYASAMNGGNTIMLGLYRYVQIGDTSTLPALCSAGVQKWSVSIFEITGVSSGFSAVHISDKTGYQASGATLTTAAGTTTANNQLTLTGFMEFGPSVAPTVTGAPPSDLAGDIFALISFGGTQILKATSGSSVQTTWTLVSSSDKSGYIQSIFGPATAGRKRRIVNFMIRKG